MRVLDLARDALAQLAHDVDRLEHLRVGGIGDVDRDELGDVVALELQLAGPLTQIEGVAQERVHRGAVDEHLHGVAEDGEPPTRAGFLGSRTS
jgi:hypothetical protein